MFASTRQFKTRQSGAILVEFAIVLPFLLLMLAGIIEFSYAYFNLNILNKSVQDGAQFFSSPRLARNGVYTNLVMAQESAANSTNVNKAKNMVLYGNPAGTGSTILPTKTATDFDINDVSIVREPNDSTAQHIRVTASYTHRLITGTLLTNFMRLVGGGNIAIGPTFTLSSTSVMRVEGGP